MNILLIEDTGCPSKQILAVLERVGSVVYLSHGLEQSLPTLKSPRFDVLVLALGEAGSAGEQLFCDLRSKISELPIVVLTERNAGDLDAVRFVKLGAQDCLPVVDISESRLHRSLAFAVERNLYELHLRRSAQRLQESKDELERLVQERTEKLTRSNEELNQFAKIASHDLQEPLRAVQGFASLLAESTQGKLEKNCEEFIEYILDGVERMQLLIRSVLIHSQINNDDSLKHTTSCNEAIEEVLSDLKDAIEQTGTIVEVDKLPRVAVARSQIIQLFQNLIGNSIKYRRSESPHIFISAEQNGGQWLFSLRDNGIGIEPQYSDKIFNMFSRLHAKTKYPGTGLGLAICKRIVGSHGGTIWVDSKLDEGSVFLFTLPMVETPRSKKMQNKIDILLAEDTPSDIRLMEEALLRSELSYGLTTVNDGIEAMEHLFKLKSAKKRLPDIILLDLNMPRKNGHEVLNEIKSDPVLKHIPVVLLTVSERDEDVLEALRQRMNYYVAKPVTADKLSVLTRSIHDLQTKVHNELAVYTDEEEHVRLVLAGNPHTSLVALAKLAKDPSERVRSRVAENPSVGAVIIETLAQDPSAEVRLGVCDNPSAPLTVLATLARDPNDDVRLGLSSNPRIPIELLKQLASDENIYVSSAATSTLAGISA